MSLLTPRRFARRHLAILAILLIATPIYANPATTGSVLFDPSYGLCVGSNANGSMTIANGSTYTTPDALNFSASIPYASNGTTPTGSVTVTDPNSSWTNSKSILLGYFGPGSLSVLNGGSVSCVELGTYANSTILVNGANSTLNTGTSWGNTLYLRSQLTAQNGAQIISSMAYIDSAPAASATLSDPITKWSAPDGLQVGIYDQGSLSVQNGAQLVSGLTVLGYVAGSSGSLTLTGSNTHWNNTVNGGYVHIGLSGSGTLNILNGATLSSSGASFADGSGNTGSGTATLDGTGSRWDITNYLNLGGNNSGSSLTVSNHATLSVGLNTYVGVGTTSNPNAHAHLTVDNATFTNPAYGTYIGYDYAADLNVKNGATFTTAGLNIARTAASPASVTVDGSNTTLTSTSDITIGGANLSPGGTGSLHLTNGASLSLTKPNTLIFITPSGTLDLNNSTLSAPRLLNMGVLQGSATITSPLENRATLNLGSSTGHLNVLGTFTQTSTGHLRIEIASDSQFDSLSANDLTTLAGSVDFVFLYSPLGTHTYQFLSAPSITSSATFTTANLDPAFTLTPDFAHGSFTITTVPEPATLTLLALATLPLLTRRPQKPHAKLSPYM